jgi:cell division septation protein DedD
VRRPPASKAEARPAAPLASEASAPASAPLTVVGSTPGYYINVGLFAEEANARRAQARLLNEGLPAFRQTLESAKGKRIRVRVGPYATTKEAQTAAARIRGMQLEAVVFKQ